MKKVFLLLALIILASCSSDDNNGTDCEQLKIENYNLVDPSNPNGLTPQQQQYAWQQWVNIMEQNGCDTSVPQLN